MTYGGAGVIYPLMVLLFLVLPVIFIWMYRGTGNRSSRLWIGYSQLAALLIAFTFLFSDTGLLQNIGFIIALCMLASLLITPLLFKNKA
ncbi:hypothetical protein CWC22_012375 [Pseudoalteromonas rubra]|uniref:Uncharacterized protein n=1 Tax=Pseudoalteromonas rubra TaxID=43658 RepID=A0A5S3V072_9GAMM|nr:MULTISPECIES: hypothetical protein [Pseudoalteromonas]MEC4087247.1 hypothetical protein [Pseudoalteromonas rubra]QPB83745.1 hypothetical protein CWC22_012375 [Pseudoalteromonas rubra]